MDPDTPIIFLDLDGVLSCGMSSDFRHLPRFGAWLDTHPDVRLVVTSDRRKYFDLDGLRSKVLGEQVGARLIDVTPHNVWNAQSLDAEFMYPRQKQIVAWRRTNKHTGPFVAIDDSPGLFAPAWPHLVLTESDVGLTENALNALEVVLELR